MGKKNVAFLSELVQLGSNLSHLNEDNSTLLHLSAAFGNVEQVKYFFEMGLDINAVNSNGDTPLHLAEYWVGISELALLKIKFLKEHGADIIIKNKLGHTPSDQHERYISLEEAVNQRDEKAVETFVEAGADVNARNKLLETPLHRAALAKNSTLALRRIQFIKFLIENKADVYATDQAGYTFLHKISWSRTPLTSNQFHDITSYLISKNYTQLFSINAGHDKMTPLLFAIMYLDISKATLSLLHKNGVNLNQYDRQGNSLLYYALRWGNKSPKLLSELVKLGADWRHRNLLDQSLLHSGAESSNVNGMRFLLNLGLDVNHQDVHRKTPLHKAVSGAKKNLLKRVQLLIDRKANVNIIDRANKTPLDLAMKLPESVVDKHELIILLKSSQ